MPYEIGSKIKTLRLAAAMTQEQLAQKLSVTPQAVSKWESGASMPDIQLLPELSVTLGTSIDALFSMTDDSRMARIENMLWDRRFLTQQEFETEERFLKDKCLEKQPRAALLLAQLYNKRAVEYREHAAPLARRALLLQPDCKDAHHAVFDAEGGPYTDWNFANHTGLIDFYRDFVREHPEDFCGYLWLLDLLIADGLENGEAIAYDTGAFRVVHGDASVLQQIGSGNHGTDRICAAVSSIIAVRIFEIGQPVKPIADGLVKRDSKVLLKNIVHLRSGDSLYRQFAGILAAPHDGKRCKLIDFICRRLNL